MNKFIVSRMTLTLMIVGLMVFSLIPDLAAIAQDKDSCRADQEGWTTVDATQIDLSGQWFLTKSTNCKGNWQWSRTVTFSDDDSTARIGGETPMDVAVASSGVVLTRNLEKVTGKDKHGQNTQTWKGELQRHEDGRIRIYGEWSGAFDYLINEGYNKDFKLIEM